MKNIRYLRVYGDNILECEKAFEIIYQTLDTYKNIIKYNIDSRSIISCPTHIIETTDYTYKINLFGGYDRWSTNIISHLHSLGSLLREGADAIVTEVNSDGTENILYGCEFCGALPAGNNAWQRCGRALQFAEAKIPFFYYLEIGGIELDSKRQEKAPRFPNPLVPFSYITANYQYQENTIFPLLLPSPTIKQDNFEKYQSVFKEQEDLEIIKSILDNNTTSIFSCDKLYQKAFNYIEIICDSRKVDNVFKDFINPVKEQNSYKYLIDLNNKFKKKISIPITNGTNNIYTFCKDKGKSMGGDVPFCLIPNKHVNEFLDLIESQYNKNNKISEFRNNSKPFAVIWIAGFKKDGTDSRPDRGLLPLFKLLFGNEYNIISIIYGPFKKTIQNNFINDIKSLNNSNGLFNAIFTYSHLLIVDNYEYNTLGVQGICKLNSYEDYNIPPIIAPYSPCDKTPRFGEHDVDTALHVLFKNSPSMNLLECMCNPPSGDWSGIKSYDTSNEIFLRWSSLPRAPKGMKRPDHLCQINDCFLVTESKFTMASLEREIGPKLKNFVYNIFSTSPNSFSEDNVHFFYNKDYEMFNKTPCIFSAIAFSSNNSSELSHLFDKCNVDIIFDITCNAHTTEVKILHRNKTIEAWFTTNVLPIIKLNIKNLNISII